MVSGTHFNQNDKFKKLLTYQRDWLSWQLAGKKTCNLCGRGTVFYIS